MQFLYPNFLFALFALAIPIIIHLFNFRRYKKIYFTNVRFLNDLEKEQKSRNRLRHLLLLFLRLLAIASIVIAFAHPFFPNKTNQQKPGKKFVSIYLDNSFSMSALGPDGELLQQAKKHASEIVAGYKEGDGFNLVTNDFELKHQHWVNRTDFLKLVSEINVSPAFRRVSGIMARINENFKKNSEPGSKDAFIISDYQNNMADIENLKPDSGIHISFIPIQATDRNNLYIDSLWFEAPLWQLNQKNTLFIKVENSGKEKITDHTLTLQINGKTKGIANFSINENSSTIVPIVYTVTEDGINKGMVSLDDYPIVFDNQYFFSYTVTKTIPVLIVSGSVAGNSVSTALEAEKSFQVTNIANGSVDYSALDKYQFIILNEIPEVSSGLAAGLKSYMARSGNIFVIPASKDLNLKSYNDFLASCSSGYLADLVNTNINLAAIDIQNPFFKNIFEDLPKNVTLPLVNKYYKVVKSTASSSRDILNLANGDPFIMEAPQGRGFLFLCASSFANDWGNYSHTWLALPVLYKMAFMHNKEELLSYTIDKDNLLNIPSILSDEKRIFSIVKDSFEFIPNQKMLEGTLQLFIEGKIRNSGYYNLKDNQNGNVVRAKFLFAYNYNRNESIMKFKTTSELKESIVSYNGVVLNPGNVSLQKQIASIESGINLWKWFICIALVFLLCETMVTRFWK